MSNTKITSVKVTEKTRKRLAGIRDHYDLSSIDAVISVLLKNLDSFEINVRRKK